MLCRCRIIQAQFNVVLDTPVDVFHWLLRFRVSVYGLDGPDPNRAHFVVLNTVGRAVYMAVWLAVMVYCVRLFSARPSFSC